jgi:putative hemolysin
MKTKTLMIALALCLLASCTAPQTQPTPAPVLTDTPLANMSNPSSAYCVEKGYKSEIRTAADGSQNGVCIFSDGSECDEYLGFCSHYPSASAALWRSFIFAVTCCRGWNPLVHGHLSLTSFYSLFIISGHPGKTSCGFLRCCHGFMLYGAPEISTLHSWYISSSTPSVGSVC